MADQTFTSISGHVFTMAPITARDYLTLRRGMRDPSDDDVATLLDLFASRVTHTDLEDPLEVPLDEAVEVIARWMRGAEDVAVPPPTPIA